jgi:hypothetical protein
MGLAINLDVLIIFLFAGNEQPTLPCPFTSGFASLIGPLVAGRLYPGYTLRVVLCLVERIATLIFLKLRGQETKFLGCVAIKYLIFL